MTSKVSKRTTRSLFIGKVNDSFPLSYLMWDLNPSMLKILFLLPYLMWDLKSSMLKILFPLPYSMWDIDSSMRKESQSKNQIQEFKKNTIKNNLLHFLK